MEKMELIAPCHFGMEAVLKREVLDLGYEISTVKTEEYASGEMHRRFAMRTCSSGQQKESFLRLVRLKQRHLMNYLRKQEYFRGRIIFRRTENSG